MHWRVKHKAKLAYWHACDVALMLPGAPRKPAVPFQRATLTSTMHLGAAMDTDNAMARHKFTLDFLTSRGWIADDRRTCLTWLGFPEQVVKRDGNYRLVLTLRAA